MSGYGYTLPSGETADDGSYGYTLPSGETADDGSFPTISGSPGRFRLLSARLRTWIGEGCEGKL
jgi:hypothetical protein